MPEFEKVRTEPPSSGALFRAVIIFVTGLLIFLPVNAENTRLHIRVITMDITKTFIRKL